MKVAYLLPGFIRNLKYFKEINKFIELNKEHQIDFYSNTYDVIGAPHKEPANKKGYADSQRIDKEFVENYLSFKHINIENYEEVDREITKFARDNSHLIRKSENFSKNKSNKMKCAENEETTLRSYYGQVRNIYKCYQHIENPSEYDLIIKSRYDAWVSNLDLNDYKEYIGENTLFGMNYHFSMRLDNGVLNKTLSDIVVFGDPIAMKTYCGVGDANVFRKNFEDKNLSSKEYERGHRGADIKTHLESVICYNYFVLNNNTKCIEVSPKHLPNRAYLPREKYPL